MASLWCGWGSTQTTTNFSVALLPQKPPGLLGTGSPGQPPQLSHSFQELHHSNHPSFIVSTKIPMLNFLSCLDGQSLTVTLIITHTCTFPRKSKVRTHTQVLEVSVYSPRLPPQHSTKMWHKHGSHLFVILEDFFTSWNDFIRIIYKQLEKKKNSLHDHEHNYCA